MTSMVESSRSTARVGAPPLVLVVEDEADLATLLTYNLEREGFRTHTALDGDEALLVAAEERPDLILLDWMLPHRSGLEVCRQLRRSAKSRDIPIIMLTARGEEADRVRGLDSGADDYISKPFSMTELLARMRAVLRRAAPGMADEILSYGDVVMDFGRPPRAARRPRYPSGPDGVSTAAPFPPKPRPGVQPRAASRRGLGP